MEVLTLIKLLLLFIQLSICKGSLHHHRRSSRSSNNKFSFITNIIFNFYPNGEHLYGTAVIVSRHWALGTRKNSERINPKLIEDGRILLRGNSNTWKSYRNNKNKDHVVIDKYEYRPRSPIKHNSSNIYHIILFQVEQPFKGKHERRIKIAKNPFKEDFVITAMIAGWGTLYTAKTDVTAFPLTFKMKSKCEDSTDLRYIKSVKSEICSYDMGSPIYLEDMMVLLGLVVHVDVIHYREGLCKATNVTYIAVSVYYRWLKRLEKHRKIGLTYVNVYN